MTVLSICDYCHKSFPNNDLLRFRIFPKWKMGTKSNDKSICSKDLCLKCYKELFKK